MLPELFCPICGNTESINLEDYVYTCGHCGIFKLDKKPLDFIQTYTINDNWRLKIRYVIKKHFMETRPKPFTDYFPPFVLSEKSLIEINKNYKIPTLLEKIDLVLNYIESKTNFLSEKIQLDPNKIFQLFFCKNNYELEQILLYLETNNFINIEIVKKYQNIEVFNGYQKFDFNESLYKYNYYPIKKAYNVDSGKYVVEVVRYPQKIITITPKGLKHQADAKAKVNVSNQCFVAMWFNNKENPKKFIPNTDNVYFNAIKPAIENDGKYKAMRIDCLEHCDDINDRMIAEIRKSRFLLVDLTGYRGGVYWEAGFAEGLGLPVIYTCHEKWFKTNKRLGIEGIHFDINHRNIIFWNEDKIEDFKERIKNRIDAIIF